MGLLDSVLFFWFVVLVTTGLFAWLAWKLWSLHSIPKQIAKKQGWSQAKLVFWLCMLGLIWKPLWIVAVVLVVIDWDALANWIRKLRLPESPAKETEVPSKANNEPGEDVQS